MSFHSEYRTRHMMTGMWGKESIDFFNQQPTVKLQDKLSQVYMKEVSRYANLQNVSIENFNFFKDYTNGGFKKINIVDMDASDTENSFFTKQHGVYQ